MSHDHLAPQWSCGKRVLRWLCRRGWEVRSGSQGWRSLVCSAMRATSTWPLVCTYLVAHRKGGGYFAFRKQLVTIVTFGLQLLVVMVSFFASRSRFSTLWEGMPVDDSNLPSRLPISHRNWGSRSPYDPRNRALNGWTVRFVFVTVVHTSMGAKNCSLHANDWLGTCALFALKFLLKLSNDRLELDLNGFTNLLQAKLDLFEMKHTFYLLLEPCVWKKPRKWAKNCRNWDELFAKNILRTAVVCLRKWLIHNKISRSREIHSFLVINFLSAVIQFCPEFRIRLYI